MTGQAAKLKALDQQEQQRRLSKADLLQPRIVEKEEFIASMGGTVTIRSLSYSLRRDLRENAKNEDGTFDEQKLEMLSIVYSLVDPVLELADVEALKEQDGVVIDELTMAITYLNMLGGRDLGKDSSPTANSDSP